MYANPALNVFLETCRYVSFTLSCTVTLILLWMILVRHSREFGTYKYLLLAFVLADLFYGLSHFLIEPVPEVYKNAFVMGGHGFWTTKLALCTWMVAYSLSFPLLSYNFIYRFVAVKYPLKLDMFKRPRVIACMTLVFFTNASIWFGINHFFWFNHERNDVYIRDLFLGDEDDTYMTHDIKEIHDYVVIIFWDNGTFHGFNASGILGGSFLALVVDIAYKTMIFTSYQILQHMQHTPSINDQTRRLHHQLFRALIYQAILPLFTAYIPIAFCCALPFFGAPAPIFSVLCPPFCALHPLIDGFIMLTSVSQFRKSFVEVVMCRVRRASSIIPYSEHSIEIDPKIKGLRRLSDVY